MQSENTSVENQHRTMMILWFALLVSQFLFLVVLFFVRPEVFKFDSAKPFLDGENLVLVIVLAATGILTFLLSFVLKARMLKQASDAQNAGLVQAALIVACALCEATTLFGFVLAMAVSYQYFFLWFALGILGILLHFPKRENLIAASYKTK